MQRLELYGFPFTAITINECVDRIRAAWSDDAVSETILFQNLHTLYLQSSDSDFLDCFSSAIALIDGMPIVSLLRRHGHDVDDTHRVAAIDLIHPAMAAAAADGKRVFVIGQEEKTLVRALSLLRRKHRSLEIAGHHGFFETNNVDAKHVIDAANRFGADLVFVGLGSPKSELWISETRDSFDASVVWACGALMEYVAGVVPTPPRWSGPMRIEWIFRLANDPRRFLTRYLVEPAVLAGRVVSRQVR